MLPGAVYDVPFTGEVRLTTGAWFVDVVDVTAQRSIDA